MVLQALLYLADNLLSSYHIIAKITYTDGASVHNPSPTMQAYSVYIIHPFLTCLSIHPFLTCLS